MELNAYYEIEDGKVDSESLDLQKATLKDFERFIYKYAYKYYHSIYLTDHSTDEVCVSQYLRRIVTKEAMGDVLIFSRHHSVEEIQTYLHDWFG